jgi:hypothetical protein
MKAILVMLQVLIAFYSCNHTPSEIIRTKRIEKSNGEIWIMPYVLHGTDTIIDGEAVCYSSKGKIKEESEYKKGLRNGWDKVYDSLGTLNQRIFYSVGRKNGYGIFYDVRGEIRKRFFIDDRAVSEERTNDLLVPIQYRVFRENGDVQYVVLFDSLGNKFYENGFVFEDSVRFINNHKDSILANNPVEIKIFTTQLPGYSRSVRSNLFNHFKHEISPIGEIKNDDFYTTINFTPKNAGKQTLSVIGQLMDKSGKIVKTDTLLEELTIY